MDNYEMARGHAAVGLAGRGVGPGRASSSSPLPRRALPHSTLGFPSQKPPSRTESQYVLVFQTGPHAAQRNFKNPPGLLQRCPPPALASRSDHRSGRTATGPLGPSTHPRGCWWQPHGGGGHGRGCRAQGKTRARTVLLQTAVTRQGRGDLQGSTPRTKVPRTAPRSVLSPWVLPGPSLIETLRSYIKQKSQSRGFQVKTKLQPFLGAWVWAKSHKTSLRFGFLICKMGKGPGAGARIQSVAPGGAGHAPTNGSF